MSSYVYLDCGGNITNEMQGSITSPHWPENYNGPNRDEGPFTCDWYIQVLPHHKVLIMFDKFAIEGKPDGKSFIQPFQTFSII